MAEYIPKEEAFDVACTECEAGTFFDIPAKIVAIPPADVRPVVLCRDCEYYQADCGWCGLFDIGMNVKDFCSRGKKREES